MPNVILTTTIIQPGVASGCSSVFNPKASAPTARPEKGTGDTYLQQACPVYIATTSTT